MLQQHLPKAPVAWLLDLAGGGPWVEGRGGVVGEKNLKSLTAVVAPSNLKYKPQCTKT